MLPVVASSRSILRPAIGVLAKTRARDITYGRVISGPPRVRISFAEKVAHGVVMVVGCSIVPFVITANIPKYNEEKSEED